MSFRLALSVAVLPLFVVLGCGSDSAPGEEPADAPRGSGPGDWTAGDYPPDLRSPDFLEFTDLAGQLGATRQYKVHVPPGYDPDVPMPLVFCFHGLGQNGVMFCADGAGMVSKADSEGFVLVMPNGIENRWNAGTCCQGTPPYRDDVGFVRAMFEEVSSHVNVDLDRVYATGLSNGGFMSYRLACDAADIFAAVAPGAGGIGVNDMAWGNIESDFAACEPSEAVSVLDVHGTEDTIVPYKLQGFSIDLIAEKNGCGADTKPAGAPESAGDTSCVSRTGCPGGVEVTACTVTGGGHVWFGSESCGTGAGPAACSFVGANSPNLVYTDAVVDFFARHSK